MGSRTYAPYREGGAQAMRKAAFLCLAGLVVMACAGQAGPDQRPGAILNGVPMPGLPVAVYEGEAFLALSSLSFLHARVVFDRADGSAAIGVARRTVSLKAGSPVYSVDGQSVAGTLAPRLDKGEFWLPASCLTYFNLKVGWDQKTEALSLAWVQPYILRCFLEETGASPRIVIEATARSRPRSLPWTNRTASSLTWPASSPTITRDWTTGRTNTSIG